MASNMQVRITKFILTPQGAYNEQVTRPYWTVGEGQAIQEIADQLIDYRTGQVKGGQIGGAGLGSSALAFARPQIKPDSPIVIANGWGMQRLSFIMEVEITVGNGLSGGSIQLIEGYTNYYGDPTMSGRIDPATIFYIDSITKLREIQAYTPFGVEKRLNVSDSSYLLVNHEWGEGGVNNYYQQNQKTPHNLRPEDVYSNLSLPSYMRAQTGDMYNGCNAHTGQPKMSKMGNSVASDYVGKILSGYQASMGTPQGMHENEFTQAMKNVQEQHASREWFIKWLDQNVTGQTISSSFTWGELMRVAPYVDDLTKLAQDEHMFTHGAPIDHRNYSSDMMGFDLKTEAAAILFAAIPALMAEYGVTWCAFTAQNMDRHWSAFLFHQFLGHNQQPMDTIAPSFQARVQMELLNYISQQGAIGFHIEVNSQFGFNTQLKISLNGEAPTPFTAPTYAGSLMAPVTSSDQDRLSQVATDFENLVTQVLPTAPKLEDIHYEHQEDYRF